MDQIGNSLEIELSFDENGQCFLLLDEHLMVSIRSVDGGWILYGMLGDMNADESAEGVARTLLALNLELAQSGSCSIALEASSDVIMLVQRIDTASVDGERLQDMLGHFVDTLSNTIAVLNGKPGPEKQGAFAPAFSGMTFLERA